MEADSEQIIGLDEAAAMLGPRVTTNFVRRCLMSGEIAGRNLSGSLGWVTTRAAVLAWVTRGNARPAPTTDR